MRLECTDCGLAWIPQHSEESACPRCARRESCEREIAFNAGPAKLTKQFCDERDRLRSALDSIRQLPGSCPTWCHYQPGCNDVHHGSCPVGIADDALAGVPLAPPTEATVLEAEREMAKAAGDEARADVSRLSAEVAGLHTTIAELKTRNKNIHAAKELLVADLRRLEGELAGLARIVGFICCAGTFEPGETPIDPPEHAAVSVVLGLLDQRDRAVRERDGLREALRTAEMRALSTPTGTARGEACRAFQPYPNPHRCYVRGGTKVEHERARSAAAAENPKADPVAAPPVTGEGAATCNGCASRLGIKVGPMVAASLPCRRCGTETCRRATPETPGGAK